MTNLKAKIFTNKDGGVYALVVRVSGDDETVIHGYKGRHFKSVKAAENSTSAYISKHG